MANICLLPDKIQEFRKALKTKALKIEDLLNMDSAERTKLFEYYAGENAKAVNTLFEEKLVLKNRLAGLKNFVSKVGEVGRYDPAKKAALEAAKSEYRAAQQERIFSPKENETFLANLAEKIMGTEVTKAEAQAVFELSNKVDQLKAEFNPETQTWSSDKARTQYGASVVALNKYTEFLKGNNQPLKTMLKSRYNEFKQQYKEDPTRAVLTGLKDIVNTISDNSISLVATLDNSFLGRQGLKTLMTHPSVWWKGAKGSFKDWWGGLKGEEPIDALLADIYSKPNYINGNYDVAKLLPRTEEQFPSAIPEKIPGLGRLFKGSEAAFKGSAIRMRTGLFDLISDIAKGNGLELDKTQVQSIGKLVNSMTARGQFGKTGDPGVVKLVLWAPRMLKANWDVLTSHLGQDITPFARKQAAINLTKIVMTTATIMAIANAISPGSAETDPRSSDFGKLKFGKTRFDITGNAASLVILAARMISQKYKSTTSGQVVPYSGAFGKRSFFDAFIDFLVNKTTPPVHVLIDFWRQKTFLGEKPTIPGELYRAGVPIPIQNAIDLKDNSSADAVAGVIADFLGISANTYK